NILRLENHRRVCNAREETERFKGPQTVMGNREPDFRSLLGITVLLKGQLCEKPLKNVRDL
ncbi:hypothetical protein EK904_006433, partial [Melospiza melodia maxima]